MEETKRKNKPGAGRPYTPEELRLVVSTVRLNREQWDQFYELGGVQWLREAVKRAYARKAKAAPRAA